MFANKSVIITGAGQGIGFAIAQMLVAEGAHVFLNDMEESLVREATTKLNKGKGHCYGIAGDASDPSFIEQMVSNAVQEKGKVDIAIANAGITLYGDFLEYPAADFFRVMQVNLGGSFFLAQAAARDMIRTQTKGSILFMSSVTAHQAHKNLTAYGMSKAALEMLARQLVIELSPHGITVNALAPGATLTDRTTSDPSYNNTWSSITPLGKAATTADVAHAALFLISPNAGHITGQTLIVDGGWTSVSPSPYSS